VIRESGPSSERAADPFTGDAAAKLRPAWDWSPALIGVVTGRDLVLAYQNKASEDVFGARSLGRPMLEAFPELTRRDLDPLLHVLRTGEVVEQPVRRVRPRDRAGKEVFLKYVLAPLGLPDRPPDGVVVTAVDVTGEIRAGEAVERSRMVAGVSDNVAGASSAESGLQALTDALVPDVADVAAVYVADRPRSTRPDTGPIPPQVITVAASLRHLGPPPVPPPREQPSPWERGLMAGNPMIVPVDAGTLPDLAPDPATAAWLTGAGAHTVAVLPLVVAGDLTGALLLVGAGDRSPYVPDDLPFLADVAARAGSAIGQLSSRQRQSRVAAELQRALLPVAPPRIAGLAVVARYVAGAPGFEVGGDWWDVQDLGGGRVAVGIGDVSGRGIPAAAVMGQARASMHAAGRAGLAPADVLRVVDGQLHEAIRPARLSEPAAPQFATACYGVIDLAGGKLTVANAGHLPPLVRRAGGETGPLWLPSAGPLGLLVGRFTDTVVPLAPGDTLLLTTDGLVELPGEDITEGVDALADALRRHGAAPSLEHLADRLLEAMSARAGYGGDDVAMVIARIQP
jgi:GAF domain-containing protein